MRVLEKIMENFKRLGRQAWLGIEPVTSHLPILRTEPFGNWWSIDLQLLLILIIDTIDSKGIKTVFIKTTGNEEYCFMVVLSCMANRTCFPQSLFLSGKHYLGVKLSSKIAVRAHKKGWMDKNGTLEWSDKVWNRRKGAVFHKPSMLVWDSISGTSNKCSKRQVCGGN